MANEMETIEIIGAITGSVATGVGLLAAIQKITKPKDKTEVLKNLDATLTEMYNKLQVEREEKADLNDKILLLEHELKLCKGE